MDHGTAVLAHHEYEEMLAPAALGALRPEEHAILTAHLQTCASCREALGRLQSAADVLPLTVEERAPSEALRERLAAQVANAPRSHLRPVAPAAEAADRPVPLGVEPVQPAPLPIAPPRRLRSALWVVAIAATLVLGIIGGVLLDRLVLDVEDGDRIQRIALQSPVGLDLGEARLEYLEDAGIVRLVDAELPEPPEGQVYQVWLIGDDTSPPAPVGVIDRATGEFATRADLERYALFAVTVEPGPLGSAAPTTDPVIVAELPDTSSA